MVDTAASPPVMRAMPKSSTFTVGSAAAVAGGSTMMLDGLRSRWTTPRWWACEIASQTARHERDAGRDLRARVRRRPPARPGVERLAVHLFHGEPVQAVVGAAGIVDGGDARVVEPPEALRLAAEHAQLVRAREDAGAQHLQGHGARRMRLARLEDNTHAALAEPAEDLEGSDLAAGQALGAVAVRGSRRRGEQGGEVVGRGTVQQAVRRSRRAAAGPRPRRAAPGRRRRVR